MPEGEERPKVSGSQFRPLYDIPFMFEAREFLRKKLIGQNVQITVDYIQPANTSASGGEFPEKTCCTVTIGNNWNDWLDAFNTARLYMIRFGCLLSNSNCLLNRWS